jgi:hypothetical protein
MSDKLELESLTPSQIEALKRAPFRVKGCGIKPQVLSSLNGSRPGQLSLLKTHWGTHGAEYHLTDEGLRALHTKVEDGRG